MKLAGVAVGALLLSGCVSVIAESRVESAPRNAGLSESISACMAGRMVDRLSLGQLRRLERIRLTTSDSTRLVEYLASARAMDDAEIYAVTASSAALCGTGLAR